MLKHFFAVVMQGLFWLLPIVAITMIALWIYEKIDLIANWIFSLIGFQVESNYFLWLVLVIFMSILVLYVLGHFMSTRLANFMQSILHKLPIYSTLKDIIEIFNSSKKGENKVLVVLIKGFANEGYNIGLMYSQKQSILKDYYSVTLSQTPIPNGGYLFEVHQDKIFVIEEATFDDNLTYLLSMGVKSMSEILKIKPKNINDLLSLKQWLKQNQIK
jgi:uncharacterized membrane protein